MRLNFKSLFSEYQLYFKCIIATIACYALLWIYPLFLKPLSIFFEKEILVKGFLSILYLFVVMCFYILVLTESIIVTKIRLWGSRRAIKNQKLYTWMESLEEEETIKLLIGESESKNLFYNLETIKYKIKLFFKNDVEKLKLYRAFLNAKEKDTTLLIIQTFFIGIVSSLFVKFLTDKEMWNYFLKILGDNMDEYLLAYPLFQKTAVILSVASMVIILVSFFISTVQKNRIRLVKEVIDIYIDELEEE